MHCEQFEADRCRSCSWLDISYSEQLLRKEQELDTLLSPFSPGKKFSAQASREYAFRNKAKMQALGFAHEPILGIVNHRGEPVSLCGCPLYTPAMQEALQSIERWIQTAGLPPYRIDKRKGELKYVLLTQAQSSGEMMLRFVVKSRQAVSRIEEYLNELLRQQPMIKVVTVNIQPVHMAILEGDEEIFLTRQQELIEYFDSVPLSIRPQSFFQTNYDVTKALYQTARAWSQELSITRIWDLFCGVGGFGLHCTAADQDLTGIEISPQAVQAASASADKLGLQQVRFSSLDLVRQSIDSPNRPQLLIVNPPRRGLGEALCANIAEWGSDYLIYSSCNAKSLVQDLAALPEYGIVQYQLFDMFAHTPHYEVLLLLQRKKIS